MIDIIIGIKEVLGNMLMLRNLRKRYLTCRIYTGCVIDDKSELGNYNVIFRNATIVNSRLGNHTFIQRNSDIHYADIGKFCSIASNVVVGLGRHPIEFVSTHPAFYSISQPLAKSFAEEDCFEPFKRTTVGNDVWIGHGALISDGVSISDGAVIAAGSVVTEDVPPYAIVGGVPARVIRYRFSEEIIARLLQLEWWNCDDQVLRSQYSLFRDPLEFAQKFKRTK